MPADCFSRIVLFSGMLIASKPLWPSASGLITSWSAFKECCGSLLGWPHHSRLSFPHILFFVFPVCGVFNSLLSDNIGRRLFGHVCWICVGWGCDMLCAGPRSESNWKKSTRKSNTQRPPRLYMGQNIPPHDRGGMDGKARR